MFKKPFPYLPFIKRDKRPRETGINYVRSPVLVGRTIEDYLEAYGDMVDIFFKRVDCFRRLLEPLFLVQFVVSLSSEQQNLTRAAVQNSLTEREKILEENPGLLVVSHKKKNLLKTI